MENSIKDLLVNSIDSSEILTRVSNLETSLIANQAIFSNTGELVAMIDNTNSKINSMNHIMKYFNKLDCNSSTPESLCYDAISKHIIKASNGKESYFITYSDGEPCWYNSGAGFSGETAKEHCKLQLNKFKKNSINILAYFIHNYSESRYVDSAFESFKQTYGKDAAMVNVDTLNELGRSINSLFERKYI
jgi:hypothetical protein